MTRDGIGARLIYKDDFPPGAPTGQGRAEQTGRGRAAWTPPGRQGKQPHECRGRGDRAREMAALLVAP